jgi:hypothetical protein
MRRTSPVVRWSCLTLLAIAGVFPTASRAEREPTSVATGAGRFSAIGAHCERPRDPWLERHVGTAEWWAHGERPHTGARPRRIS